MSFPWAFTFTTIVLPLPLSEPEVAESASQLRLPASTDAVHDTGREQFPISLKEMFCPGAFGWSRVTVKERLAGASYRVHGRRTCSVTAAVCGLPCTCIKSKRKRLSKRDRLFQLFNFKVENARSFCASTIAMYHDESRCFYCNLCSLLKLSTSYPLVCSKFGG